MNWVDGTKKPDRYAYPPGWLDFHGIRMPPKVRREKSWFITFMLLFYFKSHNGKMTLFYMTPVTIFLFKQAAFLSILVKQTAFLFRKARKSGRFGRF
jgi:uncharacterized membrane protein